MSSPMTKRMPPDEFVQASSEFTAWFAAECDAVARSHPSYGMVFGALSRMLDAAQHGQILGRRVALAQPPPLDPVTVSTALSEARRLLFEAADFARLAYYNRGRERAVWMRARAEMSVLVTSAMTLPAERGGIPVAELVAPTETWTIRRYERWMGPE